MKNETYNSLVIGDTVKIPKIKHKRFLSKGHYFEVKNINTFLLHESN